MSRQLLLLGAYVPVWIVAAVVGALATLLLRLVLLKVKLDAALVARPLVYFCVLVATSLGAWLAMVRGAE